MPLTRRGVTAFGLLGLIACARIGSPSGGPEDKVAPQILATRPESTGAYPAWDQDVEFTFDEVVSEGSSASMGLGTGDLEKLILLSPSAGVPVVHWKRDRITVRPREGWKRNRVYRVELLPGVVDLRRNKSDTTVVLTFSTGGEPPTDTLRGLAIDWVAGKPARLALIELVLLPDSLVYRAVADSGGRFALGPLPRGAWRAFGAIDQNRNLRRDRRESFDSVEVAAGTTSVAPLWLIPRDTLGARLTSLSPSDSLSAVATFSQPLDPGQPFDSIDATLRLQSDSSVVPFRSLLPKPVDDSLQHLRRLQEDSLRAARDTTRRDSAAAPRPPAAPAPAESRPAAAGDAVTDSIIASRPALFDKLVLRVDSAFRADTKYVLEIRRIRSAAGVEGSAKNVLAIPKPPPPRPAPADSVAADSTKPAAPVPTPSRP